MVKNPPAFAGDMRVVGSIPRLRRSPARGHDNSLQYSCLENPMDRGAWWDAVHRVAKSWTRLKRLSTRTHLLGWTKRLLRLSTASYKCSQASLRMSFVFVLHTASRAAFPCLFSFHSCPTALSIPPLTVNQWVGFARAPSAEQKDLFLARLRGSPMFCREWGRVELLLWETIPGSNMSLHLHPIIAHRLISSDLGHAPMGAMVRPVRSVSFVRNHVSFKLGIWTWLLGLKQKSPASGNFTSLSMSAEPAALGRLSRVALGSQDWVQLPMAHCRLI